MPVKRTALGRIKHEGAWVQETKDGKIVVYMGDDERNEYIYRYVSNLPWRRRARGASAPSTMAFSTWRDSTPTAPGEWLPLTPDNPALGTLDAGRHPDQHPRRRRRRRRHDDGPAGVDRYLPRALTAIATLTNNNRRGTTPASVNNPDGSTIAGAARPPVDAVNPRVNNVYGHIITWTYDRDLTEPKFAWDIFALAGDPTVPAHGSTIVGDKYGSPDGIYVAPSGRLWIQTDVSTSTINTGAYAGFGNNQMLCANPATRRDPPLPRRAESVRDHRRVHDAGRDCDVRRHPAPGRDGGRITERPGKPEALQLLARR